MGQPNFAAQVESALSEKSKEASRPCNGDSLLASRLEVKADAFKFSSYVVEELDFLWSEAEWVHDALPVASVPCYRHVASVDVSLQPVLHAGVFERKVLPAKSFGDEGHCKLPACAWQSLPEGLGGPRATATSRSGGSKCKSARVYAQKTMATSQRHASATDPSCSR